MKSNTLPNESTLIKAQAISGGIFGTFLTLHLANAATGLFGHLMYNGVQKVFRVFYQHPLIEPSKFFLRN